MATITLLSRYLRWRGPVSTINIHAVTTAIRRNGNRRTIQYWCLRDTLLRCRPQDSNAHYNIVENIVQRQQKGFFASGIAAHKEAIRQSIERKRLLCRTCGIISYTDARDLLIRLNAIEREDTPQVREKITQPGYARHGNRWIWLPEPDTDVLREYYIPIGQVATDLPAILGETDIARRNRMLETCPVDVTEQFLRQSASQQDRAAGGFHPIYDMRPIVFRGHRYLVAQFQRDS